MKEIKKKIKDSIFGEFNQELIGDKVTLQNKLNKLQRMIDMINYLQPIEDAEVDAFVLPEKWRVRGSSREEQDLINDFACKLQGAEHWKGNDSASKCDLYINNGKYEFGKFFNNNESESQYTEITFEQFKKHVLNK